MKRMFSALAVGVLGIALFAVPAMAMVKTGDYIQVRQDEVVDGDFFAAGEEVTIEGTVNGDVYVGANRLNVRGTVNGDVIAGAANIEITGTVTEDVRVAGNNISLIGAEVGDSVTVGGNELSIDRDSTVGGGLIFGGRLLSLSGDVGRGIVSGNETTRIDSTVGDTVRVAATDIVIDEAATINGDLEYRSDNEASIRGTITGQIIRGEGGGVDLDLESTLKWLAVGFTVWAFVGTAIVAGVLVLLAPKIFEKARSRFMKKPWANLGWGALALLAVPPIAVVLFITVFGIPLALFMLAFWILAILLAKIFTAHLVGYSIMNYLHRDSDKYSPRVYPAILLGLLLYYLMRFIPGLGMLVRFLTTIAGLGLMLNLYSRPKKKSA
ncbi:MAG: polymer-forming cytoskeletal protein [Candidatus Saccharimonadales bacterium]|nr:polymer-forming cytoskeletal protein [Candidatus Saccharimonadales bacterium]